MKKNLLILILILLSAYPLLDLLHPGLPITHDGQDHVARIANFYKNLEEGNIIPRWAGNLNWGYGHPILMFLYPLPSYLSSFFHLLHLSFVDSTKLVFGLSFIASGLAFYLWMKSFISKEAAFVSAILYLYAPYRFVDLYVRGALGEHVAFFFMPLILYFILRASKKFSSLNILGGAMSLAGLILSHNAISLMFIPVVILYSLYLKFHDKTYFKSLLLMLVLALGLSAFFWIPAFFEGKYTLRDIVTASDYKTRFVAFKEFVYGPWNYGGTEQLTKQIGIVQWLMVILSIPFAIWLYTKKNRQAILFFGTLLIFVFTLFIMSQGSSFIWDRIKILQDFQFPWRFLSITVLVSAVLGGLIISQLKRYTTPLIILISIALVFFNRDYYKAQGYKTYPESFFTGIYNGTTDTGESSPIWSVRFMEHKAKAPLEFIAGKGAVKVINKTSTLHEYRLSVRTDKARLKENTLYFPGWNVSIDGLNVPIEFQDQLNRGIITFFVDKGDHDIKVKFEETRLRLFSDYLSLISLIFAVFLLKFKKI